MVTSSIHISIANHRAFMLESKLDSTYSPHLVMKSQDIDTLIGLFMHNLLIG